MACAADAPQTRRTSGISAPSHISGFCPYLSVQEHRPSQKHRHDRRIIPLGKRSWYDVIISLFWRSSTASGKKTMCRKGWCLKGS